jgi:hypothetical protein
MAKSGFMVTGNEAISVYKILQPMHRFVIRLQEWVVLVFWPALGNANLHWESSKTFNVGIDLLYSKQD